MKDAAALALRARHGLRLLLLLVLAVTLLIFLNANDFARRAAGWIHEGFLAVYIYAESFVSGCF